MHEAQALMSLRAEPQSPIHIQLTSHLSIFLFFLLPSPNPCPPPPLLVFSSLITSSWCILYTGVYCSLILSENLFMVKTVHTGTDNPCFRSPALGVFVSPGSLCQNLLWWVITLLSLSFLTDFLGLVSEVEPVSEPQGLLK